MPTTNPAIIAAKQARWIAYARTALDRRRAVPLDPAQEPKPQEGTK